MESTSRAVLFALVLTGCGGAAAGSAAPAPPPEPPAEPTTESPEVAPEAKTTDEPAEVTVDEVALAFERAEGELDTLLAAVSPPGTDRDDDRAAKKTPRGPTGSPRPAQTRPHDQAERQAASACSRACSALDSMERSSDRLCSLTGSDDPRCQNVRERLDRARQAVSRSCRQCEG